MLSNIILRNFYQTNISQTWPCHNHDDDVRKAEENSPSDIEIFEIVEEGEVS